MTRHTIIFLQSLLTLPLISACDDHESPGKSALSRQQTAAVAAAELGEPCALVLVPLRESGLDSAGSTDHSITRHQQAAARVPQPLHHLDRLGWAFVAKARESRDSGYYKLAEQTAACMEEKAAGSPESLLLRGHALHNLHQFSEAEKLARNLRRAAWIMERFRTIG